MYAEQAEQLYRETSPYHGPALDNHCVRLAEFALALGHAQHIALDEDLLRAVTWLHDIGLMVRLANTRAYTDRGLVFVAPLIETWQLSPEQHRVVREMMLYNHALRPIPGLTPQAEVLRRAVQVEHSVGLRAHGLDRGLVRDVFTRWPRAGLSRVLVDFARVTLRHDGPRALVPIFLPKLEAP